MVSDSLLYVMAREHVEDSSMIDDCVQEARIKVWQVERAYGSKSPAYMNQVARRRIKEVSKRQTWTGHTGKHGKAIDPIRLPHESLDQLLESGRFGL
jgi:DNA-directed RNA polymerase specialized sigma24 family protein